MARFYRELYGDAAPRVGSAVVDGTANLRLAGMPLRARFRFTHDVGDAYRHRIDVTLFGRPALRVDERFVDGRARLELPFGVTEGEPAVDEAARLGLWAEAIWFPAAWVVDPRARWSAVDDATARLTVPHGARRHTFEVRFDPDTGLLRSMRIPRYKEAGDAGRTPWLAEVRAWGRIDGHPAPLEASLTWQDEGRPWITFRTESLRLDTEERLPPVLPDGGAARD